MKNQNSISRRFALKSSVFGLLAVSIPSVVFAKNIISPDNQPILKDGVFYKYPSIDDDIVAQVVGASHSNLEKIKTMVSARPELSRATWDWGFGDWETALGAASHVGRRDIAQFLMENGARPDIFTYAMLGALPAVKSMIEAQPGVQTIAGPHGISLLQHAKNGLRFDGLNQKQKNGNQALIDYLESLGNADIQAENLVLSALEKERYLGEYKYGDGPEDGFSIKLNMRDNLSFGKLGNFGGMLYRTGADEFIYNAMPTVKITFNKENNKITGLTIHEPDFTLTAKKMDGSLGSKQ
ncbi:hypothetical protein [Sediminicola sp. YIK13]|uniref:hypothetical protein n=1 Tax=Sediminicola sp. YIK13 TaxID=1453352 RepID=UPI000AEE4F14|nr:hypothetical protein [Sediminicola sp. YIK13]